MTRLRIGTTGAGRRNSSQESDDARSVLDTGIGRFASLSQVTTGPF